MKVNLTLELEDKAEVLAFVHFIEQHTKIIDWSILTNTSKMYKEDTFFKSITKSYYKSRKVRNDYINDNNYKYE